MVENCLFAKERSFIILGITESICNLFKKIIVRNSKCYKAINHIPELGKSTDIENIRVLILDNYSIFYQHDLTKIEVVTFWDNRQNPETLEVLLSLLKTPIKD